MSKKNQPADFVKWLQGQLEAFRARRFEEPGGLASPPYQLYVCSSRLRTASIRTSFALSSTV